MIRSSPPTSRPRESFRFRLRSLLVLSSLLLAVPVAAHPTAAYGDLMLAPAIPVAGEPVELRLRLADPNGVPVEDAYVLAEFRPAEREGTEPAATASFEETQAGRYRARVILPDDGGWQLLLRDRTFRQEEARATLEFSVGSGPVPPLDFVFPPTRTGPSNLAVWAMVLIGVPLLGGAVLTVWVYAHGAPNDGDAAATEAS